MSLAEKFDEFAKEAGKTGQRLFGFEDLQRAFYSGAEAVDSEYRRRSMALTEFETEIENFRSHK